MPYTLVSSPGMTRQRLCSLSGQSCSCRACCSSYSGSTWSAWKSNWCHSIKSLRTRQRVQRCDHLLHKIGESQATVQLGCCQHRDEARGTTRCIVWVSSGTWSSTDQGLTRVDIANDLMTDVGLLAAAVKPCRNAGSVSSISIILGLFQHLLL